MSNGPVPGVDFDPRQEFVAEQKRDALATVIDALAPDASSPAFPYQRFSQVYIPGLGTLTHEGPIINGQAMPGQWLLTECSVQFGWQIQQGAFQSGATLVPTGNPPTKFKYEIRIWASNDAQQFRALLGTMFRRPVASVAGTSALNAKDAAAVLAASTFGIDDPSLKDVGITQAVLWSVTPLFNPLARGSGKGPWTASIEFMQAKPLKPSDPLPDQSQTDIGPVNVDAWHNMQTAQAAMAQDRANKQAAIMKRAGL